MHSTNVRQIKAALVDQAFHGTTQVRCPLGRVVAVSRWKGHLRVMIRGWPRWYPVESVRIERMMVEPTESRHLPSLASSSGEGEEGAALQGTCS
jgi:hypothetical protein